MYLKLKESIDLSCVLDSHKARLSPFQCSQLKFIASILEQPPLSNMKPHSDPNTQPHRLIFDTNGQTQSHKCSNPIIQFLKPRNPVTQVLKQMLQSMNKGGKC